MSRTRILLLAAALLLAIAAPALTQPKGKPAARPAPKLEPVAETRLLMEGLNLSNFRGLERLLKDKPADVEAWTFIRGQALLIAETANLLMLRPPKGDGQDAWMERAAGLREAATALARSAAARDHDKSQRGLVGVANACNRCHQTFRVRVSVEPFAEGRGD
jgi:cytochrome c556